MKALGALGERNIAEIERVQADCFLAHDSLEPISRAELLDRIESGMVTVLDVRPEDEFAAGHLRRAVNIPIRDLDRRLSELPAGREVIA